MEGVVAHITCVVDEQQDLDAELKRRGGETVSAVQQAAVLHQHRRLLSGQVRAGANADAFLFTSDRHMRYLLIFA